MLEVSVREMRPREVGTMQYRFPKLGIGQVLVTKNEA